MRRCTGAAGTPVPARAQCLRCIPFRNCGWILLICVPDLKKVTLISLVSWQGRFFEMAHFIHSFIFLSLAAVLSLGACSQKPLATGVIMRQQEKRQHPQPVITPGFVQQLSPTDLNALTKRRVTTALSLLYVQRFAQVPGSYLWAKISFYHCAG